MESLVEAWFGDAFCQLNPLLQKLHRTGGTLSGPVEIRVGRGIGGLIGRRMARRMSVTPGGCNSLKVSIFSTDGVLYWKRQFNGAEELCSRFVPVGSFPAGHWVESTGRLRLLLKVAIVNGGWHWQHFGTQIWGIALPHWLMPRTVAFKEAADGRYHFQVQIHLPVVGLVLAYSGNLSMND